MRNKIPTEKLPYIHAQADEYTAVADCGCTITQNETGAASYRCLDCVRAVNSHDDLLAAAKLALKYIDRLPLNVKPDGMLPPFYELTTAIAKAEGR